MRPALDDFLTLRLAGEVRASLDKAAREAGLKRSTIARSALAAGLASLRPPQDPDGPRPGTPGAALRAAA